MLTPNDDQTGDHFNNGNKDKFFATQENIP
jgi:hypothetical protein